MARTLPWEISMIRKPYEKPAIVQSEKITTRAVVCDKADSATCASGVIAS
jgi:hypothetical protein